MQGIVFIIGLVICVLVLGAARTGLSMAISRVLFSGSHKRGKEQIARVTRVHSPHSSAETIQRFSDAVASEKWPRQAQCVPAGQDAVEVTIKNNCTYFFAATPQGDGCDVHGEVTKWRTVDSTIQGDDVMNRLHNIAAAAAV